MKTVKTIIAAAAISLLAISNANAGGFLADVFIKPFSPGLARAADDLNHRLGNPVDHAAAAAANGIVPGSGAALEAGWVMQRSGVFNGHSQTQQSPQNPPMGNVCYTQVGAFPGPFNPIGVPCTAGTPWGMAMGTVGR